MDRTGFMDSVKRQRDAARRRSGPKLKLGRHQRYRVPGQPETAVNLAAEGTDFGLFDREFYDDLHSHEKSRSEKRDHTPSSLKLGGDKTPELGYVDSCYFDALPEASTVNAENASAHVRVDATPVHIDSSDLGYIDRNMLGYVEPDGSRLGMPASANTTPNIFPHNVAAGDFTDKSIALHGEDNSKCLTGTPGQVASPMKKLMADTDELNYMDQLLVGQAVSPHPSGKYCGGDNSESELTLSIDTPPEVLQVESDKPGHWDPDRVGRVRDGTFTDLSSSADDSEVKVGPGIPPRLAATSEPSYADSQHTDGSADQRLGERPDSGTSARAANLSTSVPKSQPSRRPDVDGASVVPVNRADAEDVDTSESDADDARRWRRSKRVLEELAPDLDRQPAYSVIDLICENVIYEDDQLVCINKPYRLACQGGPGLHHHLYKYLPEVARRLKHERQLYLCHRLDRDTTGTILLAKNEEFASKVKSMFESRLIEKRYVAITNGVPQPLSGSISIPIDVDFNVNGHRKSVLVPQHIKSTRRSVSSAHTEYQVVKKSSSAALVELNPVTGRKHQLRSHLAFALNTPILGDHKYSHRDRLAPQKLPGDVLQRLKLPQSKARLVPMHLHARALTLPDYHPDGARLQLTAKLPAFFSRTIKLLRLRGV